MTDRKTPAEVFPPGDFLKEELEERGWTQTDLADILGRPNRLVSEIVNGRRGITPETALGLADAFGTSAEYWMYLEASYQLARVRRTSDNVSHRAKLYGKAPIKEMVKRNWIEGSPNTSVLERNVLDFLEIESLEEEPLFFAHAARKATPYESVTPSQLAWLFRVKHLAKLLQPEEYNPSCFEDLVEELRNFWSTPDETRHVPRILEERGIRLLIVEAMPGSKIDGVCFWLDHHSPVVALSMRFDRIDYFWHTLMHELGHVRNTDGLSNSYTSFDINLFADSEKQSERPPHEVMADQFAVQALVPQEELEDFALRVSPTFPKKHLIGFAALMNIHPGIVLGQLQHSHGVSYAKNRELLVKVRHIITSSALTDGFGSMHPAYT